MRRVLVTAIFMPIFWGHAPHIPLCEYEDGSSQRICIWDGRHQGNGIGSSAIIINGGTDRVRVLRIGHRLAHTLSH